MSEEKPTEPMSDDEPDNQFSIFGGHPVETKPEESSGVSASGTAESVKKDQVHLKGYAFWLI